MKNREVSIGICGAIVGILIGAGSVAYGQELSASTLSYRNFQLDEAYKKRAISDADKKLRSYPDLIEGMHQAPAEEEPRELTGSEKQACHTKVTIAEELREIIIALVPGRPIDQLVRHSMNQAFDSYVADCQAAYDEIQGLRAPVVVPEEVIEYRPEPISDSHCQAFTGVRRTRCIDAAKTGVRYQGGFYQRDDLLE